MISLIEGWLKHVALEVQEYVRLNVAVLRGCFSRPIYPHDIVEQLDLIGAVHHQIKVLTRGFTQLRGVKHAF